MYDMEIIEGPRSESVDVTVTNVDGQQYVRMLVPEDAALFWYNPESAQVVNPNKHRQLEELYTDKIAEPA